MTATQSSGKYDELVAAKPRHRRLVQWVNRADPIHRSEQQRSDADEHAVTGGVLIRSLTT